MFVIVRKSREYSDNVLVGIYSDRQLFETDLEHFNNNNDGKWAIETHLKASVSINTFYDGSQ